MKKIVRCAVLLLCLSLVCAGMLVFTGCGDNNTSKNDKYGYVTNSDGTRTWYEKNNKHIVVID